MFPTPGKHIDLLIVGTGGSGTTNILTELSKLFKTNDTYNSDKLKHSVYPFYCELTDSTLFSGSY